MILDWARTRPSERSERLARVASGHAQELVQSMTRTDIINPPIWRMKCLPGPEATKI